MVDVVLLVLLVLVLDFLDAVVVAAAVAGSGSWQLFLDYWR